MRTAFVMRPSAFGTTVTTRSRTTLSGGQDDMNHNDDAQLDAALTALARPEPPADHVARVLAGTSIQADGRAAPDPEIASAPAYKRPVWLMPALAAGVLVVVAAGWQLQQATHSDLGDMLRATAPSGPSAEAAPPDLNLPVLPPQAYWAMDAFDEFASLRPGASDLDDRQAAPRRQARGAGGDRLAGSLRPLPPAGLAPIELEDISPAPVVMPPLASLEDIAFADLPLTPIVMTPITEEERP